MVSPRREKRPAAASSAEGTFVWHEGQEDGFAWGLSIPWSSPAEAEPERTGRTTKTPDRNRSITAPLPAGSHPAIGAPRHAVHPFTFICYSGTDSGGREGTNRGQGSHDDHRDDRRPRICRAARLLRRERHGPADRVLPEDQRRQDRRKVCRQLLGGEMEMDSTTKGKMLEGKLDWYHRRYPTPIPSQS